MLAEQPGDRYQSAKAVREALKDPKLSQISSIISQIATMNFVGRPFKNTPQTATNNHTPANQSPKTVKNNKIFKLTSWKVVASLSVILLPGMLAFSVVKSGFTLPKVPELPKLPELPQFPDTSLNAEIARQEKIGNRRKNLNIDRDIFYQKVDELYYNKYPEFKDRSLTEKPEDAEIRRKWYEVAEDLLDKLEKGGQL
jgi:serine/threonine-protein kinase